MTSIDALPVRHTFIHGQIQSDPRKTHSDPGELSPRECDSEMACRWGAETDIDAVNRGTILVDTEAQHARMRRRRRLSKKERDRRKRQSQVQEPDGDEIGEYVLVEHVVTGSKETDLANACQAMSNDNATPPNRDIQGEQCRSNLADHALAMKVVSGVAACAATAIGAYFYHRRRKRQPSLSKSAYVLNGNLPIGTGSLCAVGSTGTGKSCLLNFMLDPSPQHCMDPGAQTFTTGETNASCTGHCRIQKHKGFTFIDSAGANESHEADLPHMIDVVKTLQQVSKLSAVALVLNYRSRMDQQWQDTILYYCRLIGAEAFKSNLIVVLTHYDIGKIEENSFMPNRHEEIIKQTQDNVKYLLKLPVVPKVFAIDCMPATKYRHLHEKTRLELLRYVALQQPVDVSGIQVEKTPKLKHLDQEKIKSLEGEIKQLQIRYAMSQTVPETIKEQMKNCGATLAQVNTKVSSTETNINDLRTEELVLVKHLAVDRKYQGSQPKEEQIVVEAPCEYQFEKISTDDEYLDISIQQVQPNTLICVARKANLIGSIVHLIDKKGRQGFRFDIKLWGFKKHKHKNDLQRLDAELRDLKNQQSEQIHLQRDMIKSHPEAALEANKLFAEIQERENCISHLRRTSMTVKEAESRLPDVQRSKL